MAKGRIHIDVFVPFFCYDMDPDRTVLNEKVLKHFANVRRSLADRARMTFTVLGSEGIESKKLVLRHLRPDEYVEYDQRGFAENFNDRFAEKMNFGARLSVEKSPDVTLIAGSNDFVSSNFFDQLLEFYDPETPQAYGIGNYYDGKHNIVAFGEYYAQCNGVMRTHLWDGVSNFGGRERFQFTGGIVGFNRAVVEKNDRFVSSVGYDEGETEAAALETPGAQCMRSKGVVFLNLKTGRELTKMKALKEAGLIELILEKDYDREEIDYYHQQIGVFSML